MPAGIFFAAFHSAYGKKSAAAKPHLLQQRLRIKTEAAQPISLAALAMKVSPT